MQIETKGVINKVLKMMLKNLLIAPFILIRHCLYGIATTAACLVIREEDKDCGSAFEARQLAVIHLIIGVAYTILTFGARFFILPRLGGSNLVMLIAGIMVFYGAYIPFYSYSQKICGEGDLMEYSGEAMGFGLVALFITECIILGAI